MGIHCCNGCVAPKRHIGCHATCKDYIIEKAQYEKEKEESQKGKISPIYLHSNGTYYCGKGNHK